MSQVGVAVTPSVSSHHSLTLFCCIGLFSTHCLNKKRVEESITDKTIGNIGFKKILIKKTRKQNIGAHLLTYIHIPRSTRTMRTLPVSSASLTSFQHNVPKDFKKSCVHAVSVLSSSPARSRFRPNLKQRSFSTAKTTSYLSRRWMAAVGENVQSSPVPTSVPVRVAHELLQAGHRYLDVRTDEEFDAGHALGAVNVPYMFRVGSGMTKNPNFVEEVLAKFGKDDEIIVGCQLGKRSLMAATDLISAGFSGITDIAGGYAAWVQNELPTES